MKNLFNAMKFALAGMILPVLAFAEEATHAAGASSTMLLGPAVGFAIGMAALGGALAQGRVGGSFMEGAARNPNAVNSMKTQFILALVFVETLVLFTLLICFMLLGKIA